MPLFTTPSKLFFFIIFKKSVELERNRERQNKLRRTNWKENLQVCGYQSKRQKGRIASTWLFVFHPLPLTVMGLLALCPCLLDPHFIKVEGDIKTPEVQGDGSQTKAGFSKLVLQMVLLQESKRGPVCSAYELALSSPVSLSLWEQPNFTTSSHTNTWKEQTLHFFAEAATCLVFKRVALFP